MTESQDVSEEEIEPPPIPTDQFAAVSLGDPEPPKTIVSPFRVTHDVEGTPYGTYFEITTPAGEDIRSTEQVMYRFASVKTKQEIAVVLKPDGTIVVGSWYDDGEWVELSLVDSPGVPKFDTSAFGNALENNIRPS